MDNTLKTNKDRPIRLLDGHSMILHYAAKSGNAEYWRCTKYTSCPARAKIDMQTGQFELNPGSAHNHLPNPVSPIKRERRTALKQLAKDNIAIPSSSLAADAHKGLDIPELQAMPTMRALQQTVASVRKVNVGSGPDKEPGDITLPDMLKNTERNGRFLIADSRNADADLPVFFAFGSDNGAEILREHRDWCIDGTFFAAPHHFDSLLIIHALVDDSSALPAVYIILPNRRTPTYERAFKAVFESAPFSGIRPRSYIVDFEPALSSALRKQFPLATQKLCHFHLAKNAWLQVQRKGLLLVYSTPQVKALLRSYPALAFLPPDEVADAFDKINSALSDLVPRLIPAKYLDNLNQYARYFERTYVGQIVRGKRMPPRYEPNTWSVFQRTLDGEPRTNNSSEGCNASLNRMFPKSDGVLSQFIVRIKKFEERTRCMYERNTVNRAEPVRGRPKKIHVREANLRALVQEYAATPAQGRDQLKYLEKVQFHLSETAFERLIPLDTQLAVADAEQPTAGPSNSQPAPHSVSLEDDSQVMSDTSVSGIKPLPTNWNGEGVLKQTTPNDRKYQAKPYPAGRPSKTLRVCYLRRTTTAQQLMHEFGRYGEVEDAIIPEPQVGYVLFKKVESAKHAQCLNGKWKHLDGDPIKFTLRQTEWEDSGQAAYFAVTEEPYRSIRAEFSRVPDEFVHLLRNRPTASCSAPVPIELQRRTPTPPFNRSETPVAKLREPSVSQPGSHKIKKRSWWLPKQRKRQSDASQGTQLLTTFFKPAPNASCEMSTNDVGTGAADDFWDDSVFADPTVLASLRS